MERVREQELMDDPRTDPRELQAALRALTRTNRWTGSDRRLRTELGRFGRPSTLSVLDVGCGGGGFLASIDRSPAGQSMRLRLGIDRSIEAVRTASQWHNDRAAFLVGDGRTVPLRDRSVDVAVCSLFLHHFDPDDVCTILREMKRVSRRGVVVCDLTRSRIAWMFTWVVTRLLSRSRLFHVDGPRSVRAAYTVEELRELARLAGLHDSRSSACFPFRTMLTWTRKEHRDEQG